MKAFATTVTAITLAGQAAAFWRMPCRSQTGIGRMDPLVDPGAISDHVHTIHGGGGFGTETDYDKLNSSSCTSCGVTEDKSAYWTPSLHFQYPNGTTVMVQQVGGMLAYYLYYLDNVKAFPEGFAMIAGNPSFRNFSGPMPDIPLSYWPTDPTDQFFLQQRALGFNCLDYDKDPEPSLYRHKFPPKEYMDANCKDGIRLELAFPSCGNGDLTSPDYRSHVAYPSLVKEGNCPEGFDVHYPFLFFETIWATDAFAGVDGTFMLSTGDPVGPSYHGDFIMGWHSADFLQDALDTCKDLSGEITDCSLFTIQGDDAMDQCKFDMPADLKEDDCHGPRNGLPVDVPVQWGPEPATKYPVAGKNAPTTSIAPSSTPATYKPTAVGYVSADAASTSTAQGGIVVALASEGLKGHQGSAAASYSQDITSASSAAPTQSSSEASLSTTYITQGNEVIEMVIKQTQVTVTATPSPTNYAKRHLQKHQHHHI